MDFSAYARGIRESRKLFDIAKNFGHNFNLLDLGGGFLGDKNNSLIECADIINTALDTHFSGTDVRIIAEPGRYFVTTANTLMTSIHSKRQIITKDGVVTRNMYFINDGIYGNLSCVFNENTVLVPKLMPTTDSMHSHQLISSTIWGPTIDPVDKVVESVMLPDLQLDDLIAFEGVGAYSTTIATEFNGLPMAKSRYFLERSVM